MKFLRTYFLALLLLLALPSLVDAKDSKDDPIGKLPIENTFDEKEVKFLKEIFEREDVIEFQQPTFSSYSNVEEFHTLSIRGDVLPLEDFGERSEPNNFSIDNFNSISNTRVKVNNTTIGAPYNATTRILILRHDDTISSCSGSFISPTHILTAAHCVYDKHAGGLFHKAFIALPSENGYETPYRVRSATNAWITSGWRDAAVPDSPGAIYLSSVVYDFAVIKVDDTHSNQLNVNTWNTIGTGMNGIGYPGNETGIGDNNRRLWYMYRSPGQIQDFSQNALIHNAHITPGQSGGPIRVGSNTVSVISTTHWGPHFSNWHLNIIASWKTY